MRTNDVENRLTSVLSDIGHGDLKVCSVTCPARAVNDVKHLCIRLVP